MANTFFRFKQFTVRQEKSAMKVCTDACIFGAFIAEIEKDNTSDKTKMLDIGAGTGLLSLMIAQKANGTIDAVEIDKNAFEQAKENFLNSEWQARLSLIHADVKELSFEKKYDIILSNPPFFESSLKSPDHLKNLAKHATSLPFADLVKIACENLLPQGRFYLLLPIQEFEIFEKVALERKLFLNKKILIKQREKSGYFRAIGIFSLVPQAIVEETVTIRNADNTYSDFFSKLLKDYYLYL